MEMDDKKILMRMAVDLMQHLNQRTFINAKVKCKKIHVPLSILKNISTLWKAHDILLLFAYVER